VLIMLAMLVSILLLLVVAPGLILGVGYAARSIAARRAVAPATPEA
jgi:hypothetical protein